MHIERPGSSTAPLLKGPLCKSPLGVIDDQDDDVRAPARVEQVIKKVREMAEETGASAEVVEQVYRAIPAFITEELATHAKLANEPSAT